MQKRTSGLILSDSSALPPDIVMEKDLYPPVDGNIFYQGTNVALLRFELRFPIQAAWL